MDERDRRRYNDDERDYYTNNDRRDRDARGYRSDGYRDRGYADRSDYSDRGYGREPGGYRPDRDHRSDRPDRERLDRDYRPRDDYRPAPQRQDEPRDVYRPGYDNELSMQYTQTDEKKKKGLFAFGKKDDANVHNVIITYPRSYEDVSGIIDSLRSRQAIIVDFRRVAGKDTQRVLDFLSGAIYALGGSQQRINDNMFLFTPEGVTIQGPSSLKRRYD